VAKYFATIEKDTHEIDWKTSDELTVGGNRYSISFEPIADGVFMLKLNARNYRVLVEAIGQETMIVRVLGRSFTVHVQDELVRRIGGESLGVSSILGRGDVLAPMPGLVVGVRVREGDQVQRGSTLVILEAMKMENEIRAVEAGTVTNVRVKKGAAVDKGDVLLSFQLRNP